MSALDKSTDPSVVLRTWIHHINHETQLGLEVTDDHICAIENQDGSIILVNALDEAGYVLLSSPIATLPEDSESQLNLLKAIALANFRDLVSGPAKWSLHPNSKDLYYELALLNPYSLSADDFAEKLFAFMSQHQMLQAKIRDGSFAAWATSNFEAHSTTGSGSPMAAENFIRI